MNTIKVCRWEQEEDVAADIKAAYQRGIGRSPRIVLRHAEAAHMALQEVDRD